MIAFTADNHLGIESQWSLKERKDDFLSAFGAACAAARSRSCKGLLLGGDTFDMVHPPSFAVAFVQQQVRDLAKSGIPVFGIDGNHDIADGKWLDVCGIIRLSEDPVEVDGHRVCGLGHRRSDEIVTALNVMADRGVKCDILVLHLAFGELNRMGAASDVASQDILPALKALGVRLVLMGHIHIQQEVTVDGVTFLYCGSTEVCSVSEPKDKSITLIDTDLTRMTCPIATRPFVQTVIGSEREFAAFETALAEHDRSLHAVFIASTVADGVKRLRNLAHAKGVLMRIQTMRPNVVEDEPHETIDRTTGIIGLEQAIGLSFTPDSSEARLIRTILQSPESLKPTVDAFVKGE